MNRTQPCQGKFTVSTENRTINITSLLYYVDYTRCECKIRVYPIYLTKY